MSHIEMRARRQSLDAPAVTAADLMAIHVTGFYFCLDCQKVCQVKNNLSGPDVECLTCGTHRVKWCKPIPP